MLLRILPKVVYTYLWRVIVAYFHNVSCNRGVEQRPVRQEKSARMATISFYVFLTTKADSMPSPIQAKWPFASLRTSGIFNVA